MENPDVKFLIENTSGKWSKVIVDSVEYLIKFEVKEVENVLHSITCCLSDFESMWLETIKSDKINERLKRCNPLLACNEMMARIIPTITAIPQNGSNAQLTVLNNNDWLHLNTKYHLSDGSDAIPLKFYWQLEKGVPQSFYELLSGLLHKIAHLEKANDLLNETVRDKDEKLEKQVLNNQKAKFLLDGVADESDSESTDIDILMQSSGICHDGVTCNYCQKYIVGHRYTCIECEDYDLCMACEHKELQHTHHIMVRYAQPGDKDRAGELFQAFSKQTTQQKTKAKRKRCSRM